MPNITIGPAVVAAIRPHTSLPLDVHLMIENPQKYIKQFAQAGAGIITVHVEVCPDILPIITAIQELGVKAGVSINPETPVDSVMKVLQLLDLVLVMSVHPGFGGQSFIEDSLEKITIIRAELDKKGLTAELEVDGGINALIAPRVVKAGGRVLVAGSAVFNSKQTVKEAVQKLRDCLG